MRDINLKDIQIPESFQKLCEELLSAEYPDFEAVDDTAGDQGCDGRAQGGLLFFQMYYPEQASFSEKVKKVKKKIHDSLRKLSSPYPKNWILLVPEKVPNTVHDYCRKKENKFSELRIHVWSEPKLMSLLHKHDRIKEAWVTRIYGPAQEVIQPESVLYNKRNDLPGLLDQNRKFGNSLKDWKFSEHYEQVHHFTSSGAAVVSLRPKNAEALEKAPLTVQFLMKFDESQESKQKLSEFQEAQKKGNGIEFGPQFFEKGEIRIGGMLLQSFDKTRGELGTLKLEPVPSLPQILYLDLCTPAGVRLRRFKNLEAIVSGGTEDIRITNEKQNHDLQFSIVGNRVTGESNFSMWIRPKNSDAIEALEHAEWFKQFHDCTLVRIGVMGQSSHYDLRKDQTNGKEADNIIEVCRALKEIQEATGENIPSFFERLPSSDEEIQDIMAAHAVITTGCSKNRFTSLNVTFGKIPEEQARKFASGAIYAFKEEYKESTVSILGKEISLGPVIRYCSGRISDESANKLLSHVESGCEDDITVDFIPGDVPYAFDIYLWWVENVSETIERFDKLSSDQWNEAQISPKTKI